MFLEQLVPVPDAHATGDQVVDAVARAVPPGLEVSVMGAQNIKGTGLDWVYRWVALDRVQTALASLKSANPEVRRKGFDLLDGFEDHGIIDSGLAKHALPALVQAAVERRRAGAPRAARRRASPRSTPARSPGSSTPPPPCTGPRSGPAASRSGSTTSTACSAGGSAIGCSRI